MRTAAASGRLEGSRPALSGRLTGDAKHAFAFFEAGRAMLEGLTAREERMEVHDALRPVRSDFMARHAEAVYAELTAGFRDEIRVEELVFEAAERFPGLVPPREAIAAERRLPVIG